MNVAPYQVHVCTLNPDKGDVEATGERLYQDLLSRGVDVLLDDRPASPGVKFNDADLLGIPFRVTVSPRTLANSSVEVKRRDAKDSTLIPVSEAADALCRMACGELAAEHGAHP